MSAAPPVSTARASQPHALAVTPPANAVLFRADVDGRRISLRAVCLTAGVTLAHYLESSTAYRIVLYTGHDFFEYTPSMLRVLCDPSHMRISHCAFRDLRMLTNTRVELREELVVELAERGVKGQKSGWMPYDKLVLAMGSDYPDPLKLSP